MGKLLFDLKEKNQEETYFFLIKNANICVVDFYADWCGPCVKLGQTLEMNLLREKNIIDNILTPDLLKEYSNDEIKTKIVFIKVNIDILDDIAEQFKIETIPHVVFFKKGELQTNIAKNYQQIIDNVNKLL
jgi:thioredoxin-like negative regulator of GroEL